MYLTKEGIVDFLLAQVEPVFQYYTGEKSYRAACYLRDGTYFPCVEFRLPTQLVNRAINRLDDARVGKIGDCTCLSLLQSFLIGGNRIDSFFIKSIEQSPFALPARHRNILYEAANALKIELTWEVMPFVAEMEDGNRFAFWFQANNEFFEMPNGYTANRINSVFPNCKMKAKIYSNKISFDCYLEDLV